MHEQVVEIHVFLLEQQCPVNWADAEREHHDNVAEKPVQLY